MINISKMKDDELLEFVKQIIIMGNNREIALSDPINLEKLKERKVISKDYEKCDKLHALRNHVNPEYKNLIDSINQEITKRNLI